MSALANRDFVLRGDSVELRRFTEADVTPDYIAWLNDPVVVRYSNQRFRVHNRETCIAYLNSFDGSPNLFLSVRRSDSDEPVGTMTAYFSPHHGTVDVGIMIGNRAAWGQGFGQDAWSTLVDWLLTHPLVRKVTAGTLACNNAMLTLMERSGMTHEATRHAQEIVQGAPTDILYYARFKNA